MEKGQLQPIDPENQPDSQGFCSTFCQRRSISRSQIWEVPNHGGTSKKLIVSNGQSHDNQRFRRTEKCWWTPKQMFIHKLWTLTQTEKATHPKTPGISGSLGSPAFHRILSLHVCREGQQHFSLVAWICLDLHPTLYGINTFCLSVYYCCLITLTKLLSIKFTLNETHHMFLVSHAFENYSDFGFA